VQALAGERHAGKAGAHAVRPQREPRATDHGTRGAALLVPGFLSLALAGVILGLAFQWTGELSASIGIHAGWIFWLKYYGLVTKSAPGADVWFWGTRKLTDGWLAFVAIVVVLALLGLAARRAPLGMGGVRG
jgi:membrane protease YdiL (CAAX protease family)